MRSAFALVASVTLFLAYLVVVAAVAGRAHGESLFDALMYSVDQSVVLLPPAIVTGFVTTVLLKRLSMLAQSIIAVPFYLILVIVAGDIHGRITWIEPYGLMYAIYGGLPIVGLFVLVSLVIGRVWKRASAEHSDTRKGQPHGLK